MQVSKLAIDLIYLYYFIFLDSTYINLKRNKTLNTKQYKKTKEKK